MVYSNDGKVDFEGRQHEILSDVVVLIRALKDVGVIDEEDIQEIARLSTLSKQEVSNEAMNLLKNALNKLKGNDSDDDSDELFKDLFGDIL